MSLEESLAFLDALFEATSSGAITWRIVSDDDRDMYACTVDGETVTIEQLSLPDHGASERAFVRIVGLKTWLVFARGTQGYDTTMRMLSQNIFGWDEGQAGAAKSLRRAAARVRGLIGK